MGATDSFPVSKTIAVSDDNNPDESPILRHNITEYLNGGQLISTFRSQPEANTPIRLLKGSSIKYADNRANGERTLNPDGSFGKYTWLTYKEFYEQVTDYSRGLQALGLSTGDKVGIYSHNCRFWQTTCYGSHASGLVPVPVYDSLGPNAAQYIIEHAECKAVVVHHTKLNSLLSVLPQTPGVHTVITIGCPAPTGLPQKCITAEDVVKLGKSHPEISLCDPDPDTTGIIMYTSGSTGNPKGCVLSHRAMIAGATGLGCLGASITTSDTFFSFLPLAHIYELGVEYIFVAQGGSIGFFTGSVKNLLDDMNALQPTIICGVPRVFNRIVDVMKGKIANLPPFKRKLINSVIQKKIMAYKQGVNQSLLIDALLFKDFKKALGGRVRMIVSGGAPILPDVYEFMKVALTPIIIQGYGLTECAAGLAVQEYPEYNPSNVGAISITSEAKLRRVEGLEYDPRGTPMCGELLVRGPHVFKGYYKNEELTKETLIDGEWLATGDIVMITENGLVQIIDRAKQLVKLSQGEYISMTSINEIYGRTKGVSCIYVYADSHHDQPAAVIVPTQAQIDEWKSAGITDIVNSPVAKAQMVEFLEETRTKAGLRGFERITKIMFDLEEFTIENKLLTPSMKPQWQSLRKKYEAQILELFDH